MCSLGRAFAQNRPAVLMTAPPPSGVQPEALLDSDVSDMIDDGNILDWNL